MPRLSTALQIGALSLAPLAALSQDSITIEAAEGFRFIRCVDLSGLAAQCEYLSDSDERLDCVAVDEDGEPMAVDRVYDGGPAMFRDLSADAIATVICE